MRDKTKPALDAPDAIGINNFFSNHSRLLFFRKFAANLSAFGPMT
jgi:hypothetical protein